MSIQKIDKKVPFIYKCLFSDKISGGVEFLGWVLMATFFVVFLISVLALFCGLSAELFDHLNWSDYRFFNSISKLHWHVQGSLTSPGTSWHTDSSSGTWSLLLLQVQVSSYWKSGLFEPNMINPALAINSVTCFH